MNNVVSRPKRVAGYEVIEPAGGSGGVRFYRAKDSSSQRAVSLKVVSRDSPNSGTAELISQLREEARVSAVLKHPGIVEVLEYGDDGALAFLASEFVEGCRLRPQLNVPPSDAVSLIVQILEALEYAHNQGVSHLSLKPSCLILTNKGQLKVADFGVSDTEPTPAAYLSPEQLDGLALDHRTDLFIAGVLFYEFLTGMSPFSGTQTIALQQARALMNASPANSNAALPPAFITICAKALESRIEDRYQTAGAFCDDIRRAFHDAFAALPSPLVSSETVVSIFLATLRGKVRRKRIQRGGQKALPQTPSSLLMPKWDDRILRRVAEELSAFVGPVAIAVVKEAASNTKDLDRLYDVLAESLATPAEQSAFLSRRPGTSTEGNDRELHSAVVALPATSRPSETPAHLVTEPKPEAASFQSASPVEPVLRAGSLSPKPSRTEKKFPVQTGAQRTSRPEQKGARSVHALSIGTTESRSRKPELTVNSRLEELLVQQPENLAGYLKRTPPEITDVIYAFISATEALAARHAEKNNMIGLTPESVCFDRLGKATIRTPQSTVVTGSTMGAAGGSPRYAAPEIFADRNDGSAVGAGADIYALGFMFYEILLGTDLFRATFAGQRSDLDWLRWHTDSKNKAPQLQELLPECPAALSELIESMIAKETATRTSDAAVLVPKLRSIAQQANKTIIAQGLVNQSKKNTRSTSHHSRGRGKGIILALVVAVTLCSVFVWRDSKIWPRLASLVRHYVSSHSVGNRPWSE